MNMVFMPLMKEGAGAWCLVDAYGDRRAGETDLLFRIGDAPSPEDEDEEWQFPPGSRVRCEWRELPDLVRGPALVAVAIAPHVCEERRTLDELDPPVWGPPTFGSYLVTRCHELRRKPLAEFTAADLRIMIGQQISLAHLVPPAIDLLEVDFLVEGDHFPGDLLNAVLRIDEEYWREHPEQSRAVAEIVTRVIDRLETDPLAVEQDSLAAGFYDPGDLLRAVLRADEGYWREHPEQSRDVAEIVTRAIDRLETDLYDPGDLLRAVLRADERYWREHPEQSHALTEIVTRVIDRLETNPLDAIDPPELVNAVLGIDQCYWHEHPEQWDRVNAVVAALDSAGFDLGLLPDRIERFRLARP